MTKHVAARKSATFEPHVEAIAYFGCVPPSLSLQSTWYISIYPYLYLKHARAYTHTSSGALSELRVLVLTVRTRKWYSVFGESPATSQPFARPLKDATVVLAALPEIRVGETPLPPRAGVAAAISRRLPATPSSRIRANLWAFFFGGQAESRISAFNTVKYDGVVEMSCLGFVFDVHQQGAMEVCKAAVCEA